MTRTFWWRDDDADRADPKLDRLLALAAARERPVTVAVVPEWLEPATVERLRASSWATVVQHGVAHVDYAGPGQKKIELGGTVDRARLEDALVKGRERLEAAFGAQFVPAVAPPWNHIDDDVAERLAALGFIGLSCDGGPPRREPVRRIDIHVDAIDWHDGARSRSADELEAALEAAVEALAPAPVGLLTHHLVVSDRGWADLDRVLALRHDDERVVWASAHEVFGEP